MFKRFAILASAVSLSTLTHAQSPEPLETIEVSADFQQQTLNQTPQSIAIIDSEVIQKRSAQHLQEVLNTVGNINFSGGTSTARFIQIRGIGERSQFVDNVNPSVGLIIDGIDYSGLGGAASLFDIGQVEVFRGPQSGRFGVNSLAGMVVMQSEQPTELLSGKLALGLANYDERRIGLAIGGNLGVLGNARLSVQQFYQDGFTNNVYLNRDDTEQRDELAVRLGVDSQINELWSLQTQLHHIDTDNGYDAFSLENNRETLSDEPGKDDLRSTALRLGAMYHGFDSAQLEIAVSGLTADSLYSFDEDWTYVGIAPGWEYSSFDAYTRQRDDLTLDVRLTSKQSSDLLGLPTKWTLGIYHYQKDQQLSRDYFNWDLGIPTIFNSDQQRRHYAVYGELIQQLAKRWSLLSGLRLERDETDYNDSNNVVERPADTMVGGNLSLRYQLATNSYWYTTIARGYKAGGVNGEALGRAKDQQLESIENYLLQRSTFAPEHLWNLESGFKWSSGDGMSGRVSGFYNWREDVQLKSWIIRDQSFVGFLENAASGKNYGLEAEVNYQLMPELEIFANVGWLKTRIDGFVREDGTDISGREQAHAPNYTANIGLQGSLWDNWAWSVQADAKDSFYFSNSHDQRAQSSVQWHAQLSYYWSNWQLKLWGRNLTDEQTDIRGFYFGNDPRDEYVTETYRQYGEPRRIGFTAEYKF